MFSRPAFFIVSMYLGTIPGWSWGPGHCTDMKFRGGPKYDLTFSWLLLNTVIYLCPIHPCASLSQLPPERQTRASSKYNAILFGTFSNPDKNWIISSFVHADKWESLKPHKAIISTVSVVWNTVLQHSILVASMWLEHLSILVYQTFLSFIQRKFYIIFCKLPLQQKPHHYGFLL